MRNDAISDLGLK